jgi:glycosyltransferase involved in cell wall biosynthesis
MYIHNIPAVDYIDPWKSTFAERFKSLVKGDRRVAYYYEVPDSSTFRYRAYNMIQVLQQESDISAAYFHKDDLNHFDRIIDHADVIVICRASYSDKLNRMITRARNKGKLVFYDIDDLIFNPAYVHLVLNTLNQDIDDAFVSTHWFAHFGMQSATLSLCDQAITTNEFLAERIRSYAQKKVSVIPNFLNMEQMEVSQKIYQAKKASGFERDRQIHLGYFSGSPTHSKDLMIVTDALLEIMKKDPRVVLRIVGYMNTKGPLDQFSERIERLPFQDFINLQRLMGDVEINLVPLQDNEFTNCKSELKYFEAGIAGTATIASPTFTYAGSIRDGENGVLAKSYEWYEKIQALIDQIDDLPVIAEKAYAESEQKFAWYNQTRLIEKTLFPENPSPEG